MQVFIANIDSISKTPDVFVALLSPKHRARVPKFQNQTRKLQFILGHLMVDNIDKKHTSIAHKDNWVVVAAASNALVGIDIENTTIERDFMAAADLIGEAAPKSLNEFYKMFTKQEAIYKLGVKPKCTRFTHYKDYLICMTASRHFEMPRLRKFDVNSILSAEQK